VRIDINRATCMSFGVCVQSAPDLFALDDEGDPVVLQPEPGADAEADAELAQRSCPTNSVLLS
jgi:ferredoxin